MEYYVAAHGASLPEQCTRSKTGRTLQRDGRQELLDKTRVQAHGFMVLETAGSGRSQDLPSRRD